MVSAAYTHIFFVIACTAFKLFESRMLVAIVVGESITSSLFEIRT